MTATNKWLHIFESHGDSNRCTPYWGKLNQHIIRFPRSVHIWSKTICISRRPHIATFYEMPIDLDISHCFWENGSRHNPQHAGQPIRGSVPSFSPEPTNEAVAISQAPVSDQLLALPGSYHRHVIGTFNTCSRGPIHRSLTDTGGGYNFRGAGLPHITPRPSQPVVSTFP
jgi:hypothetical protein